MTAALPLCGTGWIWKHSPTLINPNNNSAASYYLELPPFNRRKPRFAEVTRLGLSQDSTSGLTDATTLVLPPSQPTDQQDPDAEAGGDPENWDGGLRLGRRSCAQEGPQVGSPVPAPTFGSTQPTPPAAVPLSLLCAPNPSMTSWVHMSVHGPSPPSLALDQEAEMFLGPRFLCNPRLFPGLQWFL